MAKKSFIQGAFVLGAAGIVVKFLGAVFRIPLGNMIGDEGMAYYQAAYPIYVMFLMIATAGVPTAISKMVSERTAVGHHYEAYRVFRISFIMLFCMGVVSAGIVFFGAGAISNMIALPEAKIAMQAISLALLFCPLMASYRGYFQGQQEMGLTATSQITEQFVRVVVGLGASFMLVKVGLPQAAAGATFGATAGGIAGLATVMFLYIRKKSVLNEKIDASRDIPGESTGTILKKICIIAIPVTIGAAIMPIMNLIDVGMVVRRLTSTGWTYAEAKAMYGQLSGFVASLINFPQVLAQSLAMSLVPAIAGAFKQGDGEFVKENITLGMRFSILVGFPCAFGLFVMSKPILLLLYPYQKDAAIGAAPCLAIMAIGVIFLTLVQTLTGMLQGISKQMIPVRNLAIGAVIKIAMTYFLVGVHFINVKGAAIGTVCAYAIASTLDIIALKKYTGVRFDWSLTVIRPLISVLTMSAATFGTYRLLSVQFGNAVSCLGAVAVAVITYFAMIFITKSVKVEELALLPKGDKLVGLLNKFIKSM